MHLNKTKLNDQVNILTLFVRSFGFLQGASLRPSEVVQVVRRAMDDWLATPQESKRTTKPSLLLGEPANSSTLICKNEPNFPDPGNTATPCSSSPYNDLLPEFRQKKRTQNETKRTQFKPNFRQVALQNSIVFSNVDYYNTFHRFIIRSMLYGNHIL